MSKMNIKDINSNECFGKGSIYNNVFVSINSAKFAKEVGYNISAKSYFTEYIKENVHEEDGTSGPFGWELGELEFSDGYFKNNGNSDYSNESYISYALPTQSELQRWLREEHNLHIIPCYDSTGSYMISIFRGIRNIGGLYPKNKKWSYEDAIEAGLQETLKLLRGENE